MFFVSLFHILCLPNSFESYSELFGDAMVSWPVTTKMQIVP